MKERGGGRESRCWSRFRLFSPRALCLSSNGMVMICEGSCCDVCSRNMVVIKADGDAVFSSVLSNVRLK